MLVANTVLGHRSDPAVAERLEQGDSLQIDVSETERRRSRFRTTAADGTELGVVVAQDLADGDVLEADGRPVLVRLEPIEAVALDFADADVSPTEAMAVGHAVGNRHWTLAVEGDRVLIPTGAERQRIEAALDPLLDKGVEIHHVEVSPATFDGAETSGHGDNHDHGHTHADGHDHHHAHDVPEEGDHGR